MKEELLPIYVRANPPSHQHIESFNRFCDYGLREVIRSIGSIEPGIEGYSFKLGNIRIEQPMVQEADGSRRLVTPMEARMRNLTYASPIYLEITPTISGIEREQEEVFIGELPIMVKSKPCHLHGLGKNELIDMGEDPLDPGGYFIVNGTEKVLISLEDLVPNRIIVGKDSAKGIVTAKVFSTRFGFRARCSVERTKDGRLQLTFPAAPPSMPVIPFLRVLGFKNDKELLEAFSDNPSIRSDILYNIELDQAKSYDEALDLIGRKAAPGQAKEFRLKRAEILVDTYLLPHLGTEPDARMLKAYYLIGMLERTILVANGKASSDDRDHYMNKRVKLAGELMQDLFRYAFQFLIKDVTYQVERSVARGRRITAKTAIRPDALTDRIKYALATGNWIAGQTGVSQMLDRTNFFASNSHLRRLISPLSRRHPHFKARDLHGTHWGKVCIAETPEGPSCSLVKNYALMSEVSLPTAATDDSAVIRLIRAQGVKEKE
ncbi:MAG: DNA-directed RNA polymerase subunit B'' [Candidatus Micrarchaeota archaeon]|nr:DNA-directed RNA polymerase subunit B'' [Candidatus Micrarchaeota archaeon]